MRLSRPTDLHKRSETEAPMKTEATLGHVLSLERHEIRLVL